MRTERPTPWGFDVWDPRLELRRAAAEAQHAREDLETPERDDADWPDEAVAEAREPVANGGRQLAG